MGDAVTVLAINLGGLMAVIAGLWFVARSLRDATFMGAFWAFGIVLLAWGSAAQAGFDGLRTQLLLMLVTLWGMRLSVHLFLRWQKWGEDPRYGEIIERAIETKGWDWPKAALLTVFLVQAPLLFVTCLPAQIGIWASATTPPATAGLLAKFGTLIALAGIAIEATGDAQLTAFRAELANRDRVLDTGLWRYSRHPNYFGDALAWWGIWMVAADAGWAVALTSLAGPILLTLLLTRWSGKPLLEQGLLKRRSGYADYVRRTSAFIPWPPKRLATAA